MYPLCNQLSTHTYSNDENRSQKHRDTVDEYRYNGEDDNDEDESGNKKKNTIDFDKYVYNSEAVDL